MVQAAGTLIGDAAEAAREEVALYRRQPERLPELELGSFEERPAPDATRLRLALRFRLPPRLLRGPDRFVRAYAFWHAARRALRDDDLWHRLTHGTTVLMYHAFASAGEPASRFVLPVAAFERQLRWLRRRRQLVDLAELAACRRDGRLPPANAVAITIDDGYAELGGVASLLRGVPATVFVVTAKVGGINDWDRDREVGGRELLSWEELGDLARQGLSVGAHTRTHPQLPLQSLDRAREEIAGSRRDVEARLGGAPESFAFPFGRVNDDVATIAADAGFALAFGIESGRNGPATPPHRLRRVEIDGRLSFPRFVRTLAR